MYVYYSSEWLAYVLLLLKLITCTHLFNHQMFLKLLSLNLGTDWYLHQGYN